DSGDFLVEIANCRRLRDRCIHARKEYNRASETLTALDKALVPYRRFLEAGGDLTGEYRQSYLDMLGDYERCEKIRSDYQTYGEDAWERFKGYAAALSALLPTSVGRRYMTLLKPVFPTLDDEIESWFKPDTEDDTVDDTVDEGSATGARQY
ncbi:MAG: hypothetical protein LBJ19_00710, partial [Holosporaceae bacterium]|nr:hypothetical protein [Holosporaceae bacterium]